MAVHVSHPIAVRRRSTRARPRSARWTPGTVAATAFFGSLLTVMAVVCARVLPPLVSQWQQLTAFERPIGWFVAVAVVVLTVASGCATAAAVLWWADQPG